jgi:enterochelin esterase-like enzyme
MSWSFAAGIRGKPAPQVSVLYLNDGQNLFDGATSYIKGEDWGVDETAERLIELGEIEPVIVVGIYNTGEHRVDECTPRLTQIRAWRQRSAIRTVHRPGIEAIVDRPIEPNMAR